MRSAIRWFKCKLKPPNKRKSPVNENANENGTHQIPAEIHVEIQNVNSEERTLDREETTAICRDEDDVVDFRVTAAEVNSLDPLDQRQQEDDEDEEDEPSLAGVSDGEIEEDGNESGETMEEEANNETINSQRNNSNCRSPRQYSKTGEENSDDEFNKAEMKSMRKFAMFLKKEGYITKVCDDKPDE